MLNTIKSFLAGCAGLFILCEIVGFFGLKEHSLENVVALTVAAFVSAVIINLIILLVMKLGSKIPKWVVLIILIVLAVVAFLK